MQKIWQKIKIKKIDEMGKFILYKAQRNAYFFLIIALLLWSFYESYRVYAFHDRLNIVPCFLLTGAVLIQTFSQLILTRWAVKDDEDSFITEPLIKIVTLLAVVIAIIATGVAAVLIMGVPV